MVKRTEWVIVKRIRRIKSIITSCRTDFWMWQLNGRSFERKFWRIECRRFGRQWVIKRVWRSGLNVRWNN